MRTPLNLLLLMAILVMGNGGLAFALPVSRISSPVKTTIQSNKTEADTLHAQSSKIIEADLKAATMMMMVASAAPLNPTILVLTPALGVIDKTKALSNSADFLAKDLANALRIRLQKHQVLGYTDALPVWKNQKLLPLAQELTKKHKQGQLLGTTEWGVLSNSLKTIVPSATIDRLVIVEAEVDFSKPYQPFTKKQNFLHWLTEIKPTDALDVWLVHITVYNMANQPYEPLYRWQYRTTLPADRMLTVFPEAELNRSSTPWLVQASRQVETAFLKEVPFEVLNDEWASISTVKGWHKTYNTRSKVEKGQLLIKELKEKPSQ